VCVNRQSKLSITNIRPAKLKVRWATWKITALLTLSEFLLNNPQASTRNFWKNQHDPIIEGAVLSFPAIEVVVLSLATITIEGKL
jgi:hypothetical protein